MSKKIELTPEELEARRVKKNSTLREWRSKNKEYVSLYMKNWYALKGGKEEDKITYKKFKESQPTS